jgi:hypothetical protein
MITNTCISYIQYESEIEMNEDPFWTIRDEYAKKIVEQGKAESYPNSDLSKDHLGIGSRLWVDRAAAQEFIDWVVATAPNYNITIVSTAIEDLPAS